MDDLYELVDWLVGGAGKGSPDTLALIHWPWCTDRFYWLLLDCRTDSVVDVVVFLFQELKSETERRVNAETDLELLKGASDEVSWSSKAILLLASSDRCYFQYRNFVFLRIVVYVISSLCVQNTQLKITCAELERTQEEKDEQIKALTHQVEELQGQLDDTVSHLTVNRRFFFPSP